MMVIELPPDFKEFLKLLNSQCVSEKWLRDVFPACGHTLRQVKIVS